MKLCKRCKRQELRLLMQKLDKIRTGVFLKRSRILQGVELTLVADMDTANGCLAS